MIDARTRHAPGAAPVLVEAAEATAGTQKELAARLGVSTRYLQRLANGSSKNMSYVMQVALEAVAKDS